MCDVSSKLFVGSAFLSLLGGVPQSTAITRAANFNAAQLESRAQQALQIGNAEAINRGRETRQQVGAQRAAFGASGVVVGSGSSADVIADTVSFGAEDEAIIRNNASRAAWGFQEQAKQERYQGKANSRNALVGGFTTALTTGARAYGLYKRRK
jgi:hypothetical protein